MCKLSLPYISIWAHDFSTCNVSALSEIMGDKYEKLKFFLDKRFHNTSLVWSFGIGFGRADMLTPSMNSELHRFDSGLPSDQPPLQRRLCQTRLNCSSLFGNHPGLPCQRLRPALWGEEAVRVTVWGVTTTLPESWSHTMISRISFTHVEAPSSKALPGRDPVSRVFIRASLSHFHIKPPYPRSLG